MSRTLVVMLGFAAVVLWASGDARAENVQLADTSALVKCVSDCVTAKGEDYEESCKVSCAGKMSTQQVDCGANLKACRKSCKQAEMSCK
jgi:hypothetical protein